MSGNALVRQGAMRVRCGLRAQPHRPDPRFHPGPRLCRRRAAASCVDLAGNQADPGIDIDRVPCPGGRLDAKQSEADESHGSHRYRDFVDRHQRGGWVLVGTSRVKASTKLLFTHAPFRQFALEHRLFRNSAASVTRRQLRARRMLAVASARSRQVPSVRKLVWQTVPAFSPATL